MNNTDQDDDNFWCDLPDDLNAAFQAIQDRRAAQVGQPFDPTELVRLATEQWPDLPLVAASFALCTLAWNESECYTYFLGYAERGALIRAGCEFIDHPTLGELLVDLMLDERVEGGVRVLGIDYLDRVFGQNPEDFRCEILWPKDFDLDGLLAELETPDEEPCPHMRIVHIATTPRPAR
ncbi:MAG: hypothetical protein IPH05_00215 [Flavobacteriales bacterium]|jgi:hypothetical protein|nr:hypothetical protein [Flavobacteriales bacterium]MBK6552201.1 hypothetical protein [Flavobacteriales bacterium]MBK6881372.1 hypothetical protein [Flavobacteriales bacterium]MBK7102687.1 hypothetical protein [Flavobacteriales bacterium]MBK7113707.1 hypothetical protein [Flavobacteriales bacterium]